MKNEIELLEKMVKTDQIEGKQSVLAHGESVFRKLKEILKFLKGSEKFPLIKAPLWLEENRNVFLKEIYNEKDLFLYTVFHDCGKPFCRIKDEHG